MTMAPAWLTARPIAHRGLHDCGRGAIIENSSSAAKAAMARGYAIECDVQMSGDGEAMVFHDFTLERLTERSGRVDGLLARALQETRLRGGGDAIATLPAFLDLIGGATPLVCEIKSRFDGDLRLAERVAACAAAYDPARHEAPIVIGHPATDDPAWGWIKSLTFSDGVLIAEPDQALPVAGRPQAGFRVAMPLLPKG
jgi:glycerophosphoryl diester phosphodiesterase